MKKGESNVNTLEKDKEESKDKDNKNKGKTFGDRIVEGRSKKGLSQEAFAEKMGVSRQMVSRWELNTAMPRTQKIKMISEILEIPINELIGSKIKGDFTSPQIANHINWKAVMKRIAVILIILIVLYFAYVGYKFVILNGISSKLEQYKTVNNYYFKIECKIDGVKQETKEVWYKDGYYKIKETNNFDTLISSTTSYLDLNNNFRYIVNDEEKTYVELSLMSAEMYEDGKYMYSLFPSMILKEATDFKEWAFKPNAIYAYYKDSSLFLTINNERLEFNKDSYLPLNQFIKMEENKNSQSNHNHYDIKLDSVDDIDVKVPTEYTKMN